VFLSAVAIIERECIIVCVNGRGKRWKVPGLFCKIELPHNYHRKRKGLSMADCNTKLMEELLSGGNVDEIFRQEIENAVNVLLEAEITAFLGHERYSLEGYNSGDSRNRSYTRTIHSRYGDIQVKIPRDRNGQFKQQTVPAYGRNTGSLEETVIHLYRKGILPWRLLS